MSTVSIIIAVVGCLVGLAGWLYNRDNKNSNDAEWKGTVNAKLDIIIGLQNDMNKVHATLQDHETRVTILEKNKGVG